MQGSICWLDLHGQRIDSACHGTITDRNGQCLTFIQRSQMRGIGMQQIDVGIYRGVVLSPHGKCTEAGPISSPPMRR